jgi:transposase
MGKKKQVGYSSEFQEKAVMLTKLPGRTIADVALELGIPAWKLRTWIKESKEQIERSSDMEELRRLHNENKRLKEENEILKKAAAYFAKTLQ